MFGESPMVFGAFPSLHSGCVTLEVLFLQHFFPYPLGKSHPLLASYGRGIYWLYVLWLWWATMYLSHHYLIDVTAGACLATTCFYLFMPESLRHPEGIPSRSQVGRVMKTYEPVPAAATVIGKEATRARSSSVSRQLMSGSPTRPNMASKQSSRRRNTLTKGGPPNLAYITRGVQPPEDLIPEQ